MRRRRDDRAIIALVACTVVVRILDLAAHVNFVLTVNRGKEIMSGLEKAMENDKPRRSWREDNEQ